MTYRLLLLKFIYILYICLFMTFVSFLPPPPPPPHRRSLKFTSKGRSYTCSPPLEIDLPMTHPGTELYLFTFIRINIVYVDIYV